MVLLWAYSMNTEGILRTKEYNILYLIGIHITDPDCKNYDYKIN